MLPRGLAAEVASAVEDEALAREANFARSLYLFGPVGRGKTTAMDLFYEELGRRPTHIG